MKTLAIFVALIAATYAQDPLEKFKSTDSILFTTYNADTEKGFLEWAPADPNDYDVGADGFLNKTMMVFTREGFVAEYWGMTASYEDGKIWLNNFRRATLSEYDINTNKLKGISKDLTNGLENLAYDRVTKMLYWTDSIEKAIFAMERTYLHFTQIFKSDEVSPYAIALHTTKRKLFFTSYKSADGFISKTELVKCDLDGSNKQTLLKFPQVLRPRGLTIDFSDDKLYWTDINFSLDAVVMASDLDGRLTRQFFAKPGGYLWGIAHYKDYIYVTDLINTTVNEYEVHIRHKNGRRGTTVKTNLRPRNVAIYGPNEVSKSKVTNECDTSRCEQVCLASSSGNHVCRCSNGYQLRSNFRCVASPLDDDFLLIADVGQKRLFQLQIESRARRAGDLVALSMEDETTERIFAVAVGPESGDLVWHDQEHEEIVWSNKRISFKETVASVAIHCCEDKIFWTGESGLYSWDGKSPEYESIYVLSFFSNANIRQVTVDCIRNQVYWVEYDSVLRKSAVKRSDLMGRDVELVLKNLPVAKGITIDYETYTLYVMSMIDGMLYSIPLKMLERIPSTNPTHFQYNAVNVSTGFDDKLTVIMDIAVKNGMIYLADGETSHLWRFVSRKGPSTMEQYGPKKLYNPATLDFYDRQYFAKHMREACPGRETTTTTTTEAATTTARFFESRNKEQETEEAEKPLKGDPQACLVLLQGSGGNFMAKLVAYISCMGGGL